MENNFKTRDFDKQWHEQPNFKDAINSYIKNIDSIVKIAPLIMKLVVGKIKLESRQINEFINNINLDDLKIQDVDQIEEATIVKDDIVSPKKEFIEETTSASDSDVEQFYIPVESIYDFMALSNKIEASTLAYRYLPISLIVSLVSQYDAYLSNLIKTIFFIKPEILNSSERNILYTELISFKSIDEAKDSVIEKEIESVMRENHLKQIKWLENKISIKLREDIPTLRNFIELTERRNLFVHCNGTVSRQYLDICKENGVPGIENIKLGDKLEVKPEYLKKGYSTLFEIGIKLGHVLWRKLQPDMIKEADENLNVICYDLICVGRYNLAINLLTFATETLKKHPNQEVYYMLYVNKALAYYLKGDKNIALEILNTLDWSATQDKFKLAIEVLNENYPEAAKIMKNIGPNNTSVTKNAYREWPLFTKFRDTDLFKKTYRHIYKEDFIYKQSIPSNLESILEEIKIENEKKNKKDKNSPNS